MHMLIAALDYKQTGRPLTFSIASRNVEELARQCGVQWLTALYEEECTVQAVTSAVKQMTSKCGPDDVFLFYFAGHGQPASEEQDTGDAFVLVDRNGQVSGSTLLPFAELSRTITESCAPETRVLFITDTPYHNSIVDLGRQEWDGRQALLISGTQDQHVEQEDSGGVFTHNLLLAIDKLSKVGRENYSVGMFFNAALHENELVFSRLQDLQLQSPARFTPDAMAWPLVPPAGYQAPLSRCAGPGGIRSDAIRLGVSPVLLEHVRQENLNTPVSIEEYVSHVQGQSMFAMKPCRACHAAGSAAAECALQ